MEQKFNLQRLAHLLLVVFLLGYLLILAKNIVAPIIFAMFFAFMLKPLTEKFEKFIKYRPVAIILSFLTALLPVTGIISLFVAQSVDVFQNMPTITDKIKTGINKIFSLLNSNLGLSRADGQQWLSDNLSSSLDAPMQVLTGWLSSSTTLLISIFLVFLYTFLLLLYRTSIKNFLLIQFTKKQREDAAELIEQIQSVAQSYLYGLITVIGILGVLNSIGLWLIGIDYPFFWGFLGALLAVIPYIGTFLGGLMPFVYAIATTGTLWQPLAIVVWFGAIQTIEGNLITPKVVGDSVEINPLTAIVSLLIGGAIWGVSGLILALPIVAVIRITFCHINMLKPVALLLSSEVYEKKDQFLEEYDEDEYRLANFFKKKMRK